MARKCEVFNLHVNASKSPPTEEALNNQVEIMSQPVEVSHALSLASPELSQKEKEQTNWPMAWLKDKPQLNYIHSY